MRPVRRTAAAVLVSLGLGASAVRSEPADVAGKAAYLAKFAPFAAWPGKAFATADAPLVICAQGPQVAIVPGDTVAPGQTVGGRAVVVRQLTRVDAGSGCQIAFIAGSPAQSPGQALRALDGAPVLTVTMTATTPGGVRGIVDLVPDGAGMRFAIDIRQAERNGLVLSSKLLAVALTVKK